MKSIAFLFVMLFATSVFAATAEDYKIVWEVKPYTSYIKVTFKVRSTALGAYVKMWPSTRADQEIFCQDDQNFNVYPNNEEGKASSIYTISKFNNTQIEEAMNYARQISAKLARYMQEMGSKVSIDPSKISFFAYDDNEQTVMCPNFKPDLCGCDLISKKYYSNLKAISEICYPDCSESAKRCNDCYQWSQDWLNEILAEYTSCKNNCIEPTVQ